MRTHTHLSLDNLLGWSTKYNYLFHRHGWLNLRTRVHKQNQPSPQFWKSPILINGLGYGLVTTFYDGILINKLGNSGQVSIFLCSEIHKSIICAINFCHNIYYYNSVTYKSVLYQNVLSDLGTSRHSWYKYLVLCKVSSVFGAGRRKIMSIGSICTCYLSPLLLYYSS